MAKKEFNANQFVAACEKAVKDGLTINDVAEQMELSPMTFRNHLIKAYMQVGKPLPKFKEGRKQQDSRDWAKVKNNETAVIPTKFLEALKVKKGGKVSFSMAQMDGETIIAVTPYSDKKEVDEDEE